MFPLNRSALVTLIVLGTCDAVAAVDREWLPPLPFTAREPGVSTVTWTEVSSPDLLEGADRWVRILPWHVQPTSEFDGALPMAGEEPVELAPAAKAQGGLAFSGLSGPGYGLLEPEESAPRAPTVGLFLDAGGVAPVGTPDQYAVPNDRTLSIAAPGFLANDIDLNGEALTAVSIVDTVDHGILAAFANGSFTYTPNPDFTGTDAFAYRMRNTSGEFSDAVAVIIEVLPAANRTPLGTPDAYALLADTTLSIAAPGFLANDIDPDGEVITAVSIQDSVDHGVLAAFANGSFTYTPNPGFTGVDSFAYRMRDASNHFSEPVIVTLEVLAGNRPPIGVEDRFAARINVPLAVAAPGFLVNDIDPDGEVITAVSIQDSVDHGVLAAFANGGFTYTPNPGFTGVDLFTYRMRDASGHFSDPVQVTIEVFPAGFTPVGTPDYYVVPTDRTLSIAAPGFLANDIDLNGEVLTAVSVEDSVDHGVLGAFANGSFNYTPSPGFTGMDGFTYRMRDASGNFSDPIAVTLEVLPAANRTPLGTPDAYALLADTSLSIAAPGFLANDIDLDGEGLTAVSIQDSVDHGVLAAFANGSFIYTPNPGFTGTDAFSYRMRDASNHFSELVSVTLMVMEGNRSPIGVDDRFTTQINTPLSIAAPGFLANDLDLDGEGLTAVSIQDSVDHGLLSAFANGSFIYTPNPGFAGVDSFAYRMRDSANNFSASVRVFLVVIDPRKLCVDDLRARSKSGKVQLTWTHTGADYYNVYRGTVSGGPYLKIGTTTSLYSTYLDATVANGMTYYYVVREADALDVETCQSNEATAHPIGRR